MVLFLFEECNLCCNKIKRMDVKLLPTWTVITSTFSYIYLPYLNPPRSHFHCISTKLRIEWWDSCELLDIIIDYIKGAACPITLLLHYCVL